MTDRLKGYRTLLIASLVVVVAMVVELATGGLSNNLVIILVSAPGIVAGRHVLPEIAPLLQRTPSGTSSTGT